MVGNNKGCCSRICVMGLGLALGVVSGLCLMLFAWAGYFFGYGISMIDQLATYHHGYAATVVGGFWGLLWGFIQGFIYGVVLGFVYNFFARCCSKACKSNDASCSK